MWATQEMISSANPSALFFNTGPQMHATLYTEGNEDQKRWAQHAFAHHWGGTMVLTEPDAGSDVGAGRTKAIAQPDGSWHIEGLKRFISGGDVGDTADNYSWCPKSYSTPTPWRSASTMVSTRPG